MTTDTSLSADSAGAAGSSGHPVPIAPALPRPHVPHGGPQRPLGARSSRRPASRRSGRRASRSRRRSACATTTRPAGPRCSKSSSSWPTPRLPILLDGDTGYGNFNNVRRLVRKLEQRGIAGVCLEDKLFPKTNSFIGERQPLADVDEFCGKIKAGKDSASRRRLLVVARVEALIAGWGLDEALRRAEAYHAAGADAILIHSKRPTADEILAFAAEWAARARSSSCRPSTTPPPTDVFRKAGFSVVIWANHILRASISAMREVSRRIRDEESLVDVEGRSRACATSSRWPATGTRGGRAALPRGRRSPRPAPSSSPPRAAPRSGRSPPSDRSA